MRLVADRGDADMPETAVECSWLTRVARGKNYAFAGKFDKQFDLIAKHIIISGQGTVGEVSTSLNYLVLGNSRGTTAAEKQARKLNDKGQSSIEFLSEHDLMALMTPNTLEAIELLKSGAEGVKLWNLLQNHYFFALRQIINLSNANLSGCDITGALFRGVILDSADLSRSNASSASFAGQLMKKVNFERSNLTRASISTALECSFAGAEMLNANLNDLELCNFAGANLTQLWSFYNVRKCNFEGSCLTGSSIMMSGTAINLKGANLSDCRFFNSHIPQANMEGASLQRADLTRCNLSQCNLHGADLTNANAAHCRFENAELSGAIFAEANLDAAILSGSTVIGADFSGASLAGTLLDNVDVASAIGLQPPPPVGPIALSFDKLAHESNVHATTIVVDSGVHRYRLTAEYSYARMEQLVQSVDEIERTQYDFRLKANSISQAMLSFVRKWAAPQLRLESVAILPDSAKNATTTALALQAWCEAFNIAQLNEDEIAKLLCSGAEFSQRVLCEIKSGADGIKLWNSRPLDEKMRADNLQGVDVSKHDLQRIDLRQMSMQRSNLQDCDLSHSLFGASKIEQAQFSNSNMAFAKLNSVKAERANFCGVSLKQAMAVNACFNAASFVRADLSGGQFSEASFNRADFTSAILDGCCMVRADLKEANFTDANLFNTDLSSADLRGAIFTSSSNLDNALLEGAKYNEATVFPASFTPSTNMRWSSKLPNPAVSRQAPVAAISFEDFMNAIRHNADSDKLSKALSMLKRDRFKLFVELRTDSLVGVVRSQTDAELVYACKLGEDGVFACCTQNLKPCGGLRGTLCKHLLVLVIGLTRGGSLKPEMADQWVANSLKQSAVLDKDGMSAIFLRYKGAEAGDVDWRPTETIPEDYYMF